MDVILFSKGGLKLRPVLPFTFYKCIALSSINSYGFPKSLFMSSKATRSVPQRVSNWYGTLLKENLVLVLRTKPWRYSFFVFFFLRRG